MYKPIKTYAAVLLSAAVLSQSIAYGAYAAEAGGSPASKSTTSGAVFNLDKLGSIALKSNVSVKLTDMEFLRNPYFAFPMLQKWCVREQKRSFLSCKKFKFT
jgi:hypothetical protein